MSILEEDIELTEFYHTMASKVDLIVKDISDKAAELSGGNPLRMMTIYQEIILDLIQDMIDASKEDQSDVMDKVDALEAASR
jgi:hypothetical protein